MTEAGTEAVPSMNFVYLVSDQSGIYICYYSFFRKFYLRAKSSKNIVFNLL